MLRGVALNSYGISYMNRVQEVAEMESAMKVKRFERDIPKYKRSQEDWLDSFENQDKKSGNQSDYEQADDQTF